jgi:DNA polymerase III subunit delta'
MAKLIDHLRGHKDTLKPLTEAAAQDRLAATLLFTGPAGIGKKLAALTLSQSLVCERSKTGACGECGPCLRLEKGQSESLMVVEPSGAQIKIEQARDILQFITLQKLGRSRIVLIDQAHLLGPQAANALLKSLEEPPAGTYFLLVTSMAASVLPTIRSRSQLVRFKPLADAEMRAILGKDADEWVLKSAHGSVEAAKRLLDERSDFEALEDATAAYINAAVQRFPGEEITVLRELLKERTSHGFVASVIQGLVRDALKGSNPAFKGIAPRKLETLAQKSLEFETDLARNVDRGLILETFAVELAKATP